jgi:hypothetical protein
VILSVAVAPSLARPRAAGNRRLLSLADANYSVIPTQAGTHFGCHAMFYVHLLASRPHGTLYAGVTSDLVQRVWQHEIKALHEEVRR